MKQDRRGSWYLLTGAVIGVALGLIYSWVISPVKYVDAPPYSMRADYKDEYRVLVASAYLYSGDLVRAEDRLAQLKDSETAQTLEDQAQRALAGGHPQNEIKALGMLALAISEGATPVAPGSTNAETGTLVPAEIQNTTVPVLDALDASPTETPQPNDTPEDTPTEALPTDTAFPSQSVAPSPTPGAPFVVQETRLICNPDQPLPLIQVNILDAAGAPVPSVEVTVTWDGGEDHFFTGLKAELGLGYGDFVMTPAVVYSIKVIGGEKPVDSMTAAECLKEDGGRYWGSWFITFVQP